MMKSRWLERAIPTTQWAVRWSCPIGLNCEEINDIVLNVGSQRADQAPRESVLRGWEQVVEIGWCDNHTARHHSRTLIVETDYAKATRDERSQHCDIHRLVPKRNLRSVGSCCFTKEEVSFYPLTCVVVSLDHEQLLPGRQHQHLEEAD
jgi:hypothetical protein